MDPAVVEAVGPYLAPGLEGHFGNPSSSHVYGQESHAAVEEARWQVASLLGCTPMEVVFTGGGSEADNLALVGIAEAYRDKGNHVVTGVVEHPAVLNTCRYLEQRGHVVAYLPVDREGRIDPEDVERAITDETILVSITPWETSQLSPCRTASPYLTRQRVCESIPARCCWTTTCGR